MIMTKVVKWPMDGFVFHQQVSRYSESVLIETTIFSAID